MAHLRGREMNNGNTPEETHLQILSYYYYIFLGVLRNMGHIYFFGTYKNHHV